MTSLLDELVDELASASYPDHADALARINSRLDR
jgi:hypothetical protein